MLNSVVLNVPVAVFVFILHPLWVNFNERNLNPRIVDKWTLDGYKKLSDWMDEKLERKNVFYKMTPGAAVHTQYESKQRFSCLGNKNHTISIWLDYKEQ